MPCSSTSQLTNASTPVLPLTQPTTPAQWNYFVARLQDIINAVSGAANRQPVNVVPADFAVYNGSTLPALSIIGATSALDTTKHQFGAASLKLTATASTVTVEFSANPVLLQPNARWIESVYIQSSRPSIAGTLAIDTPAGSYPVDISGTLLPGTWGRLYGDCDLTADFSTTATMVLTLTGCSVGDTFNLEGWQIEAGTGNLPSPFVNTTVPQTYVDTADNAAEALTNANAAQSSATAANAQLADIASDNILSPAEKPTVIRDYAVITAEQAGIDEQAVAYGITTQKAAYDAAIAALTAYLATLTTATAWNDKSGNTTIVGTTFRSNFNTVYTTRQTLLNAIYAAAQGLANAAQGTANTANTTATAANANTPTVINPNFVNGLTGWTVEPGVTGWGAQNAQASSPNPAIPTYVSYYAGSAANTALRNNACNPCQPGDVVSATCQVACQSGGGNAYVRIIFYNSGSQELAGGGSGNQFTGNTSGTSRATATAPAGAVYFLVAPAVLGYTTGVFRFTAFTLSLGARSLDEVPDSGSRFAAAQAGADKTSLNTAADTTKVNGVSSSSISPIAALMPQEAGANKTETRTSALTASLSNQTQDALGDGTTYARMKAASLTGNDFDFAKGGVNKHLGNVPDGGSRYAVINGAGLKAVSSVDANNRAGIDFTQTLHVGKSLANIPDAPGRTAQLRFLLDANIGQNATNWVHVGTLVMANGHSARFTYDGGPGYNADKHNQATSCITVRASNGASVPNLSGISLIEHGATANASVLAVRCAATAGSTSPSNTSWELWTELAAFNGGVLTVDIPPGDSFAFVNAIGADPGAASSTVVVGTGGQYIYTTAGTGLDGMRRYVEPSRMPGANMDANRRGLIDFSQGAHLGKHLGNVPDDPTSTRYAVSNIDGNRRALIDATQAGHVGAWNLDSRVADGTTYARTSTSALTGGNVDLAKAGVVNKNLANIADGGGRYGVHAVDGNNLALIDFSQAGHVNKTIDNVGDGVTYLRMPGANMDANRRGLVDFTQTGHVGKTLANMPDDAIGGRFATRVDTFANRPTAGVQGRLFHAYNQGTNGITYYDTGTAWQQVAVGHLADIQGTTDNVAEGTNKFAGEHGADITGNHNSATTTKLATARNIAGLAFDGTASIAPTLANIPDDAGSTRYAVSNIDGNRRALVDFTQAGHVGKVLDNIGDTGSYVRTPATSWHPENVPNASFASPAVNGVIPGWAAVNATLSIVPAGGPRALQVVASAAGVAGAYFTPSNACQPGDVVAATVTCDVTAGTSSVARVQVQCFDVNGNALTPTGNGDVAVTSAYNTFATATALATMPANAASFRLFAYVNSNAGATFLILNPRVSVNDLRVAGSGTTIGDQRNLNTVTWAGVRSVIATANPIAYTISGTTVNFTVTAFTLSGGGFNVGYSASSGSVTQAAGTTATWYLYYRDPTGSGGSETLNMTIYPQDLAAFADIVRIGSATVTVASGGGGSGGTGSGGGGGSGDPPGYPIK